MCVCVCVQIGYLGWFLVPNVWPAQQQIGFNGLSTAVRKSCTKKMLESYRHDGMSPTVSNQLVQILQASNVWISHRWSCLLWIFGGWNSVPIDAWCISLKIPWFWPWLIGLDASGKLRVSYWKLPWKYWVYPPGAPLGNLFLSHTLNDFFSVKMVICHSNYVVLPEATTYQLLLGMSPSSNGLPFVSEVMDQGGRQGLSVTTETPCRWWWMDSVNYPKLWPQDSG